MAMQMKAVGPLIFVIALVGCGGGDPAGHGQGTERFTTWGEDYIEHGIGPGPTGQAGFVDGWSVHYDRFLVVFRDITVADDAGHVGAAQRGSVFVDNTKPGRKELARFPDLEAKAWTKVGYAIAPAAADTEIVAGDPADLAMMVDHGYSIYVSGAATKTEGGATVTKTFHWGFPLATRYVDCHHEEEGKDTLGVVVTDGSTDTSELTTHGDHFFYDRLQASPDPAVATSLRFDEKAAADEPPFGDGDGDITLDELDRVPLDVRTYDPSGLDAPTVGAFVTALARTIGHFRGEGECTIERIP